LRPGEKLYEELLMSEEGMKNTNNSLIYIGRPIDIDEKLLFETLEEMKKVIYKENGDIRKLVKKIVPTYNYN
jgi:FlaA1/EpsC-like NDP-sugar epimerase